jgi:tol-pal system protein YbgF
MTARFALSAALLLSAGAALAYDPLDARPDAGIAPAQTYNRPPAEFDDGLPEAPPPRGAPAGDAQDPAALTMRIERLERDIRRLTGQNEELQHKAQMLEEQLRAAKADAPKPADAPPPAASPGAGKRGDAFDPASQPAAPGAPKPLGTTTASPPLSKPSKPTGSVSAAPPVREVGQPMDISHGRLVGNEPATTPEIAPSPDAPPAGPKEEYDLAVATLKAGKYEAAEKSLSAFLTKNPKSKYAPAATFNLGESFFLRGRHREAAEKYLEITTKFAQSSLAPESLLRLGQSLGAMGAKEQACASFSEIDAKYPAAPNRIKEAAQRESGKIKC